LRARDDFSDHIKDRPYLFSKVRGNSVHEINVNESEIIAKDNIKVLRVKFQYDLGWNLDSVSKKS